MHCEDRRVQKRKRLHLLWQQKRKSHFRRARPWQDDHHQGFPPRVRVLWIHDLPLRTNSRHGSTHEPVLPLGDHGRRSLPRGIDDQ